MVLESINLIRKTLPEVEHVVLFYSDGTIYQTTFEQFEASVNIPKLGDNLSELLVHLRKLYEICNYKLEGDKKLIFDTGDIDIIILELGEETHLALFVRKVINEGELGIQSIRRYLDKITDLLDIGRIELIEKEVDKKETKLKELYKKLEELLDKQQELKKKLEPKNEYSKLLDSLEKEISDLTDLIRKSEEEEKKIEENLNGFKSKVEAEKGRINLVKKELELKEKQCNELEIQLGAKNEKSETLKKEEKEEEAEKQIKSTILSSHM